MSKVQHQGKVFPIYYNQLAECINTPIQRPTGTTGFKCLTEG